MKKMFVHKAIFLNEILEKSYLKKTKTKVRSTTNHSLIGGINLHS